MKKTARMTAVAAVALLSGAVAVNCSTKQTSGPTGPDGMLSMALTLPGGVTIGSVQYIIHSAEPTSPPADKTGAIDTSNAMATPSVETSYPASTNDTVTLNATTSDGEPCTGTSSQFSVVSNGQAVVGVTLTCGLLTPDGGPGSVRVNGTVVDDSDICPILSSWTVSPLTTGPTGTINVGSTATDGNAGDVLTYKWTATPAPATDPFTSSGSAVTTFNCPGTGNFALTVTIDDHHMPTNCTATRTVNVACGLCGNGVLDPGEQCDSAAAFMNHTCDPATCQTIATVCGDGNVQPGEQCDNAAAFANNTCGAPGSANACQNIAIACGNGLVQPGEQCEPPNTATCDANCQSISACLVCETTGAACLGTKVQTTSAFGCGGLTGAAQTNCISLRTCLDHNPNCSNPANVSPPSTDPTACFCGALDAASCAGAAAATIAGPCASAYFAVYGGVTNANRDSVLGDFFAKATATGMANNVYACDVTKSCLPICP
jgi:hypothetical protein